jgi:hypothetical protein
MEYQVLVKYRFEWEGNIEISLGKKNGHCAPDSFSSELRSVVGP